MCALTSKTLDIRTKNSKNWVRSRAKNSYYVVLAARGGSATGHAFVVWGIEEGVHHRTTIRAFGLYPESDSANCSVLTRNVPGNLLDELKTHSFQAITMELIVRVDKRDFERSWRVARQWDCQHEFSLLRRDCVEFVRAVGISLGLEMPARGMFHAMPQSYIRAVLDSVSEAGATEW